MRINPVHPAVTAPRYTYTPIIGLLPMDRMLDMHYTPMPIRNLHGTPMPTLGTPLEPGSTFEAFL